MSRPTLIVFARVPAVGRGKSRLARDIGKVEAWRLSRAMTAGVLRRLADPRWDLVIRVTPDRAARAGRGRLPAAPSASGSSTDLAPGNRPRMEAQGAGDLGQKLQRALRAHARGPVAVVGTDAPDLTAARVARAFTAARRTGAAVGPAQDGGYWLLALSARRARAVELAGVRWSTAHACADTERALGGAVARLETLIDVDDLASLSAWRAARSGPARRRP